MHAEDDDNGALNGGVAERVRHIELMLRTIQADVKHLSATMSEHNASTFPLVTETALMRSQISGLLEWKKTQEEFTTKLKISVITAVISGVGSLVFGLLMFAFKGR